MENIQILIYTSQTSPRLQYIANVLLNQFLGVDFQIVTDEYYFTHSLMPKINYTNKNLNTIEISIPNSGLLFEKTIGFRELNFAKIDDLPVIFSLPSTNKTLSFDFFSMAFFLLSRYEEYLPFTPDNHGRFASHQSIASRYNFLHLPIIEIWLQRFRLILVKTFPNLSPHLTHSDFQCIPTYDIDLAWAYLHRPWWRIIGSSFNNLRKGEWDYFNQRQQVLRRQILDPYDTFDYLHLLHDSLNLKALYFFLLADYHTYDKNINPQQPALQRLIKRVHKQYQIGIHPSYQSNHKLENLSLEIKRLEQITNSTIEYSRQHYLKLHLPDTYKNLLNKGIRHDYSMGYADQIGFRAGISRSYQWYDLSMEEATELTIHPFCAMDVTLQQYLNLSPEEAVNKVQLIIDSLADLGGTFSIIWHNSSFSELHGWSGWRAAYEQIISYASIRIIN